MSLTGYWKLIFSVDEEINKSSRCSLIVAEDFPNQCDDFSYIPFPVYPVVHLIPRFTQFTENERAYSEFSSFVVPNQVYGRQSYSFSWYSFVEFSFTVIVRNLLPMKI